MAVRYHWSKDRFSYPDVFLRGMDERPWPPQNQKSSVFLLYLNAGAALISALIMPSTGWPPHSTGLTSSTSTGNPYGISSENQPPLPGISSHFHQPSFRPHYSTHSSPAVAYSPCAYRCDRFHQPETDLHQFSHHPHQHQLFPYQHQHQHVHSMQDQPVGTTGIGIGIGTGMGLKELQDTQQASSRPVSRHFVPPYQTSMNVNPALLGATPTPSPHRYYLPVAGLTPTASSAQSVNIQPAVTVASPSPTSFKHYQSDPSCPNFGTPTQQYHSGSPVPHNADSPAPPQDFLAGAAEAEATSLQRVGLSARDPLFFNNVPHTRGLLTNQQERLANGLEPNRLGSLRPGSDFLRFS